MKLFNKKTLASSLVLAAMSIGTASAMTSHTAPLTGAVGVSGAELNVRVEEGIATLFGNVDSHIEVQLAKNYLNSMQGIHKVIDQVTVN